MIAIRRLPSAPHGRRTRVTLRLATCAVGSPVGPDALIHLYRTSGERLWLSRARDLGEQAVGAVQENALRRNSLYKGEIGVAAPLADLDRPDDAAMPFYDRDTWPRTAGSAEHTYDDPRVARPRQA